MSHRTLPLTCLVVACGWGLEPSTLLIDTEGNAVGEASAHDHASIEVRARGLPSARAYEIAAVPGATCGRIRTDDEVLRERSTLGIATPAAEGTVAAIVPVPFDDDGALVVLAVNTADGAPVACGALPGLTGGWRLGITPRRGPTFDPSGPHRFSDDAARPPAGGGNPPGAVAPTR